MNLRSIHRIKNHWIFIVLSAMVTFLGIYFNFEVFRHDRGGSLNAYYHSRLINSSETKTIVVFLEDAAIEMDELYVTPTFNNPDEFSLKDFTLSYDVKCENVLIEPTTFVETHKYGKDEWIYKYKDNVLVAYNDTKRPFLHYRLNSNIGHCIIETKASYDGAKSEFKYKNDIWFFVHSNKNKLDFNEWKMSCNKLFNDNYKIPYYDAFFLTRSKTEFQPDIVNPVIAQQPAVKSKTINSIEEKTIESDKSIDGDLCVTSYKVSNSNNPQYPFLTEFKFSSPVKESGEYLFRYKYHSSNNQSEEKTSWFIEKLQKGDTLISRFIIEDREYLGFDISHKVDSIGNVSTRWSDGNYVITSLSDYKLVVQVIYSPQSNYFYELTKGERLSIKSKAVVNFCIYQTNDKPFINHENGTYLIYIALFLFVLPIFGFLDKYEKFNYYGGSRKYKIKQIMQEYKYRRLKDMNKHVSKRKKIVNILRWLLPYISITVSVIMLISLSFFLSSIPITKIVLYVIGFCILLFLLAII